MTLTTGKISSPIGYICGIQGTMIEVISELASGTDIGSEYRLTRLEDIISPPFYNGDTTGDAPISCIYLKPNI